MYLFHPPVSILLRVPARLLQFKKLFRRCILNMDLLVLLVGLLLLVISLHIGLSLLRESPAVMLLHVFVDNLDLGVHSQNVVK